LKNLQDSDFVTLHPSRSEARTAAPYPTKSRHPGNPARRPPTREEKAAEAAKLAQEREQNQRDRETKIKARERNKKTFQKMTKRGQPVMKPRLALLLSKVKKVMKED
jgi:rRNA processing